jgi:prepilin-type N-terminal cleavage/methylation domain-containing protein
MDVSFMGDSIFNLQHPRFSGILCVVSMERLNSTSGRVSALKGGFSLIEILIVLAIMGILATTGIGYMIAARPEAQLQRGELALSSFLTRARNLALSEETSVRVVFNEGASQYWIEQLDRATLNWNTVSEIATPPEGIAIQTAGVTFAGDTVQFTVRGSLMAGGSITIVNSTGSTSILTGNVATGRFPVTGGSLR